MAEASETPARTQEYVERDRACMGPTARIPYYDLVVDHARGALLYDVEGNEYIDLLAAVDEPPALAEKVQLIEGLLALEGREGQGAVVDAQAGVPRALDDFAHRLADVPLVVSNENLHLHPPRWG